MYSTACKKEGVTPIEALTGIKPDLSHLKEFGCRAIVGIPKQKREEGKLAARGEEGILVGYSAGNAYKVFLPTKDEFRISKDVTFMEKGHDSPAVGSEERPLAWEEDDNFEEDTATIVPPGQEKSSEGLDNIDIPETEEDPNQTTNHDDVTYYPNVRRSTRRPTVPDRFTAFALTLRSIAGIGKEDDPLTFEEAMSSPLKWEWKKAMKEEIDGITEKKVWSLAKLPPGHKTIGTKWVYHQKNKPDGELERYKARLVAKGFSQRSGVDYGEVYAPVARYSTLRALLATAAHYSWKLMQLDVRAAFLNGPLAEELYVRQPEGFEEPGREDLVLRLHKALYGLRQAAKAWNDHLCLILEDLKFSRGASDESLLYRNTGTHPVFLPAYVDDIMLAGPDMETLRNVAQNMARKVQLRVEKTVERFMGISITQGREGISISNPQLSESIATRLNMAEAKSTTTPIASGSVINKDEDGRRVDAPYQELIGVLLYLANTVRPDISFSVGKLSRFCSDPKESHWTASKRVIRYLLGSKTLGIHYKRGESEMVGYSDSDFAGDTDDRKSTTGFVFLLAGGGISWRSKKQTMVALSSAEAEYIALSAAVRESIWLKELGKVLGVYKSGPMLILGDNTTAIGMTKESKITDASKHIAIQYHHIREAVKNGIAVVQYTPSEENTADLLTKGLARVLHERHTSGMGLKFVEI